MTLNAEERALLLTLARAAVEAQVFGYDVPGPATASGRLSEPGAAFVSLHTGRDLRGCLGCIEPRGPNLATVVASMAAAAASQDPRFPPLESEELDRAEIEISVLGPLVPIDGPDDVRVGRDGLVVERGSHRGLLLPQVATEWGWNAETFLAETCRKAGLARSAWREGAQVFRFEAEVFSDHANARGDAGTSGPM